ncbi:helix-turn-helix domain-containing protein [Maledivibacter halophilus]|uniref:HTH cro/C1-type domain-containing protein n=1 Tax=Maledivibacter halophilus TaxID=36842 RepID=A0A1T5L7R0_9FIRM|nr:helix-turn-helix transcriptional regulator [Maledivibacter halophilus]SKC71983.1 hypothetical protein SAMN02194393_02545 [Maledivibacter halophilus]
MNKKKKPSQDILEKLADYFDVSTDYFLGKTDVRNPEETKIETKAFHSFDMNVLPNEVIR